MKLQTFPVPRAWLCQFHWQAHDQASVRSRLRAIPNAAFSQRKSSCVLPVDCLGGALRIVHGIDFEGIARTDGVAAKFAVGGEQAVFQGKNIADNREISNLAVMWKFGIHKIECRLDRCGFDRTSHECAEIASPVSNNHDLLRRREKPRDFFLDRLGRDVVSGIQDDQVLDAAADAPISANVDFALIAGMEPSVLQNAGGFLRAVPVTRKNVRAAHDDLFIFSQLHLDSSNHCADIARLDGHARIIERADAGGFREPVSLQHGNAEHQEKLLRIRSERRRATDQRAEMRAEAFANLSKDERMAKSEPERIGSAAAADVLPLPAVASFRKQGTDDRGPLRNGFFDATPDTFQQSRYIQKIMR